MLIVTVAAIIIIFVPFVGAAAARAITGLLLVFFVPGYVMLAAVFPQKDGLTNVERVILSLVFSVIIVGGVSFLLGYTSFGLRVAPIVACTSIFIVGGTISAYVRRRSLPSEQRFAVSVPRVSDVRPAIPHFGPAERLDKTLVLVLLFVLVASLVATGYLVSAPIGGAYSELYLLGSGGKASDYPTNLTVNQTANVTVGVVNHENANANYTLVVTLDNATLSSRSFTLANSEQWQNSVAVTPDRIGQDMKLSFLLYEDDNSAPLQTTHLWVNVTQ
ncbi:MAG: DUF1616 domain-containing protein [Halobacteriota archaeon]